MRVLYVTSEAYPFCKTGGLADVAGSLPPALARSGVEAAVILPLYDRIGEQWRRQMTFRRYIYVDLGWRHEYCGLFSLERQGVTWYFVDNEQYFKRPELYGYYDDGERFAFFCRAVIDLLLLSRCDYLVLTSHSTFSVIARTIARDGVPHYMMPSRGYWRV